MDSAKYLMSVVEDEVWPVVFVICKEHKALFADYEYASVSDIEGHCTLCHPAENDSLG
jgi:hypothetical protein